MREVVVAERLWRICGIVPVLQPLIIEARNVLGVVYTSLKAFSASNRAEMLLVSSRIYRKSERLWQWRCLLLVVPWNG